MKKRQTLEEGFTLVELIIVIAIMGILAGVAAGSLSLITAGNAKKCSARFNSALNEAQVQTMSLKDPTYLYLYRESSGTIMVATSKTKCNDRSSLNGVTDLKTREVGDKAITIKITQGSTEKTLGDSQMIRIVYRKDTGAYDVVNSGYSGSDNLSVDTDTSREFISQVQFQGKGRYKVKMVEETGKHFVER